MRDKTDRLIEQERAKVRARIARLKAKTKTAAENKKKECDEKHEKYFSY